MTARHICRRPRLDDKHEASRLDLAGARARRRALAPRPAAPARTPIVASHEAPLRLGSRHRGHRVFGATRQRCARAAVESHPDPRGRSKSDSSQSDTTLAFLAAQLLDPKATTDVPLVAVIAAGLSTAPRWRWSRGRAGRRRLGSQPLVSAGRRPRPIDTLGSGVSCRVGH
jgi:hypothetical protein